MFFRSSDGHRLATRGAREALALHRRHIGLEHLLLALLDPDEDTPATRALRASGAEHRRLRTALAAEAEDASPSAVSEPPNGISPTAGAYQMIGRAEGLAIGVGERTVTAEHVLLAMLLYDEDSYVALRLQQAGADRDTVWGELQSQETHPPTVDLPPLNGAPLPS